MPPTSDCLRSTTKTGPNPKTTSLPGRTLRRRARPISGSASSCRLRKLLPVAGARAATLDELRIDWATYNPVSLVLKDTGLLEKEFAKDGIGIRCPPLSSYLDQLVTYVRAQYRKRRESAEVEDPLDHAAPTGTD